MTLLSLLPESLKERLRKRAGAITTAARLRNLAGAGFAPAKIIDAGAYLGLWAQLAHKIFPAASILMIEPQPGLAPRLARLAQETPELRFCPKLLGAERQEVRFLLANSNSRIVGETPNPLESSALTLTAERLDQLAAAEGFADCDLLKLDLQGHELAVLGGAGPLFGQIEVIIVEVSLLPIGDVPLFRDVLEAFHGRGYRLYDAFGLNHRPLDGALWQADLVFVRRNSLLLAREHHWG